MCCPPYTPKLPNSNQFPKIKNSNSGFTLIP